MFYNAVKLSLVLICTLYTFIVLAEKNSIFSAGDAAFASGDYKIASELYKDKIGKSKSPADAQARRKYIIALIESGQLVNARKAFNDYQKKYPNEPQGLIEGKLLLTESRENDAKEFFTQKIKSQDKKLSTLAKFNLAEIEKKFGNKKEAILLFEEIANSPNTPQNLMFEARLSQIHLEIDNNNLNKAKQLIEETQKKPYYRDNLNFKLLTLLLKTKENKLDDITKEKWEKITSIPQAKEDPCLSSLAFSAYKAYDNLKKTEEALFFLIEAFKYALDDETRKANLQNSIHYAISIDTKKAAILAKKYHEFYPYEQAGFDILITVARALASKNLNLEAIELFKLIINNDNYSLTGRCEAANDAAIVAQKAKDYPTVHSMYKFLIDKSLNASTRQAREVNYGEFLLTVKQYEEAEKYLTSAIAGDKDNTEKAYYNLIQLYHEQKDFSKAEKFAKLLIKSKNPKYASLAMYTAADVARKNQNFAEAKKLYQDFLKISSDKEKIVLATFLVAVMDMYLGNLEASSKELEKFAINNPKNENAPQALFMAIRSSFDVKVAQDRFNKLLKNFPKSDIISISALQLSDMLLEHNKADEALKILEDNKKYAKDAKEEAEFLYSCAKIIYLNKKDNDQALKLLESVRNKLNKHPKSHLISKANFMTGEIYYNIQEYSQAVKYFNESGQGNKDIATLEIFQGRIGDALLGLYNEKENKDNLIDAIKIFSKLAKSVFPHIKIQSLYKLGECYKYNNDNREALNCWSKLIYTAIAMQKNNITPDNFWCARAIKEYIKIKLAAKTPKAIKEAQHLLLQYESLELSATNDDIEKLKKSLNEYYNFFKK